MPYVAVRSLKVQRPDGTMDLRAPGQAVPEAANWTDVERWVRRGWIAPSEPGSAKPAKVTPKPSVPVDPDGNPIHDLPAFIAKRDGLAAAVPKEAPVRPAMPTHESLSKLTKVQLIEMGEKLGLELSDTALKEELIASVLAAGG